MIVKYFLPCAIALCLAGCSTGPRPTKDIADSIRSGLSGEDHLRVATFFENKAFAYDDEAAQHGRLARSYISNSKGDPASLRLLSLQLRDQLLEAAKTARTVADQHRRASNVTAK